MINAEQFTTLIIRPTLEYLELYSESAERLLLGTALTESNLSYLKQIEGPARGLFQMEPKTDLDIHRNYLKYRKDLHKRILHIMQGSLNPMVSNLEYQAAMCRIHYLRVPEALPDKDSAIAMATYWKEKYNTNKGAGTIMKARPHFQKAIETCEGI